MNQRMFISFFPTIIHMTSVLKISLQRKLFSIVALIQLTFLVLTSWAVFQLTKISGRNDFFVSSKGQSPGNPGKPGNVLEFCLVLEKIPEFFKNEDLSWKSPEKINQQNILAY